MDKKFKNYIIYLSILTILLLVIYFTIKDQVSLQCAYVIPVYFLITLVTHFFLAKAFAKKPKNFSVHFMGGLAFKMLASLAFLTITYLVYNEITKDFVAVFMGVYLVYTLFEIIYLKPLSKAKD